MRLCVAGIFFLCPDSRCGALSDCRIWTAATVRRNAILSMLILFFVGTISTMERLDKWNIDSGYINSSLKSSGNWSLLESS
jgi:hypothetical protein